MASGGEEDGSKWWRNGKGDGHVIEGGDSVEQIAIPEIDQAKLAGSELGEANGHKLYGSLSAVGWQAPDGYELTFDQWEQTGKVLNVLHDAVKFARGDWLLYGEGRGQWGHMYTQAMQETGQDYGTLRQEVWVSGRVQLCTRVHNLSWTHHRAVASLRPDEQERWLKFAESEKLGTDALIAAIDQQRIESGEPLSKLEQHGFFNKLCLGCLEAISSVREIGLDRYLERLSGADKEGYAQQLEKITDEFAGWIAALREGQDE